MRNPMGRAAVDASFQSGHSLKSFPVYLCIPFVFLVLYHYYYYSTFYPLVSLVFLVSL
jgi:hypothetical protein